MRSLELAHSDAPNPTGRIEGGGDRLHYAVSTEATGPGAGKGAAKPGGQGIRLCRQVNPDLKPRSEDGVRGRANLAPR